MKKIASIAFLILSFLYSNAQESLINYSESQILIEGIMVNVISSDMIGDSKNIQNKWESYIKNQLDTKLNKKNGVYYINEIQVNKITDKRADLLSYIYTFDNHVSFNFTLKLGYDIYLNSVDFPEEFKNGGDFINHFLSEYYSEFLPKEIKSLKKEQKILLKELKKSNKLIKKTEKKNKKLSKQNSNPKPKTDTKLNNETININTSTIESKKTFVNELDPKIKSLKTRISTFEITDKDAESRLKTY